MWPFPRLGSCVHGCDPGCACRAGVCCCELQAWCEEAGAGTCLHGRVPAAACTGIRSVKARQGLLGPTRKGAVRSQYPSQRQAQQGVHMRAARCNDAKACLWHAPQPVPGPTCVCRSFARDAYCLDSADSVLDSLDMSACSDAHSVCTWPSFLNPPPTSHHTTMHWEAACHVLPPVCLTR